MKITEYYDVFLDFLDKGDDKRIKIFVSAQQRIIYAYARTNKRIDYPKVASLYTDDKTPNKVIQQFISVGVLKQIGYGLYEYIEYKTAEEVLEENKGDF